MKATTSNTKKTTITKLFVMLVIMFASTTAFAQDNKANNVIETSTENAVASTSMEFAFWFVGSTQTTSTSKTSSATTSEKKQMINAGFTTNNVLIKKVVKKIAAQEKGIA